MRGLVKLILDKLEHDLNLSKFQSMRFNVCLEPIRCKPKDDSLFGQTKMDIESDLLNNAELFGQLVDVILRTDAKLTQLGYPLNESRPSDVLVYPKILSQWLRLEQNLVIERLKHLMGQSVSWSVVDETNQRYV